MVVLVCCGRVCRVRGGEMGERTGILRPGRAEISADGLIVGGHSFLSKICMSLLCLCCVHNAGRTSIATRRG